jgi:hypothetical protein
MEPLRSTEAGRAASSKRSRTGGRTDDTTQIGDGRPADGRATGGQPQAGAAADRRVHEQAAGRARSKRAASAAAGRAGCCGCRLGDEVWRAGLST